MIYAVIDTNVIVSALLTRNAESSTVKVIEALLCGKIVPLYNEEIRDTRKNLCVKFYLQSQLE
ncbi:MAG: hypothetical protein J6I72_06425 [Muribaculaceae bacterium]|nr:hypothetical protein [Muribaculaceae bacterium]